MTLTHERTSEFFEGMRRQRRQIVTPEGVPVTVELADYGERVVALFIDLVIWLLRDTPGWSRQEIERVIASGSNTPIAIADPVPLYFTYITAWSVQPGVVEFRDDIYHRDGVEELALGTTTAL
jgi:hypothetical protein